MNYLSSYYKNLSEQLKIELNQLQKELTEAQDPLYGARPFYGRNITPFPIGDAYGGWVQRPESYNWPGRENGAPKPDWWDDYVRQWQHLQPNPQTDQGVGPLPNYPVRPLNPAWQSPVGGPQYKPGFPGGPRKPTPGQGDTVPDIFQQPTIPISVPGVDPGIFGPSSPGTQASQSGSSTNYY